MIVVDVNVIAYLLIDGPHTPAAREVLRRDSGWLAPEVWRHEFTNLLATSVRTNRLSMELAEGALANAGAFVGSTPVESYRRRILQMSVESKIAAYDCEYVVLAQYLGLRVVTMDAAMIRAFEGTVVSMTDFAAGR